MISSRVEPPFARAVTTYLIGGKADEFGQVSPDG